MTKNAYEIRLDILNLAQGQLMYQYEAEKINDKDTKIPTTEDVLEEADKLYSFVIKKGGLEDANRQVLNETK